MADAAGWVSAAAGVGLLLVVLADVVRTTLGAQGAGPLLATLSANLWRLGLWFHRHHTSHRALAALGVVILLCGFLMWGLLLWAGWWLVFLSDPQAVVDAQTQLPASLVQRLYYVGFTITTLGVGDYVAGAGVWQLATVAAATTGFFVLTLGVTYLLSLLPALARKRALAHYVSSLGETPADLIANQWRDGSCEDLLPHATALMQMLETLAQEHAAFPALHYFHTAERRSALPLRLAALSEALLYLESGAVRSPATAARLQPLRRSLDTMTATVEELYRAMSADRPPPLPRIEDLPPGIAVDGQADLATAAGELERHRRVLLQYVRNEGWEWADVYHAATEEAEGAASDGRRGTESAYRAR